MNIKPQVKKRKFFKQIYLYFLLTIILVSFFSLVANLYSIKKIQNVTKNNYYDALKNISHSIDTTIHELQQTTLLLSTSDHFNKMVYKYSQFSLDEYYDIAKCQDILSNFRSIKDFVIDSYIINERNDIVVASDGTFTIENFFLKRHVYSQYNINHWKNLPSTEYDFNLLAPSKINNQVSSNEIDVIPMVFSSINNNTLNNKFIIDISKDYIIGLLEDNKLTENSNVIIYDEKNDFFYQTSDTSSNINDDLLVSAINSDSEIIKFNKKRYMIIKNKQPNSLNISFRYIAIIPYTDIIKQSINNLFLPIIIIIASILLTLFIAFLMSKKIYSPIGTVLNVLKQNETNIEQVNNEIDFLNTRINKIISDNKSLKSDLSLALPYVCERSLSQMLNNSIFYNKNEMNNLLSKYDFNFIYDYFVVSITNISFSKSFYQIYSNEKHNQIFNNILIAIKNIVTKNMFNGYALAIGKNQIGIILNVEHPSCIDQIQLFVEEIHNLISSNNSFVNILTGIGGIYRDISGLHKTYQEALKASIISISDSNSEIKQYSKENTSIIYSYTLEDENKLYNYIVCGNKSKINNHINSIVAKNISKNISSQSIKQLYLQIYNTCLRVLNQKNLSPFDLLGDKYINLYTEISVITIAQISSYIRLLIEFIANLNPHDENKYDISKIIKYIEDNYNQDIYLDKIAEDNYMSSAYLSKIIKEHLGVNFHKYLSSIRINKAKDLLVNTNLTINKIAVQTGFNSRNTFIRMFKILEGITPTEYRKNNHYK